MDYNNIKAHFTIKQDHGNTCKAICPAHADNQQSLAIKYDSKEGKTIVKCFAGCEIEDICKSAGLNVSDLFDNEQVTAPVKSKKEIDVVYDYTDENGNVVFQKVRFKPKSFSQRREIDGATVWGLEAGTYYESFKNSYSMKPKKGAKTKEFKGVEPILYNLPNLINAIKNQRIVFIVEGEKDCENLKEWNLTATCNFDGASASERKPKWRSNYNHYFENAHVVIINDNDDAGRAHALNVAENLKEVAASIKIIELPELDEKGDFSDWKKLGHTKQELAELIKNAENWEVYLHLWRKSIINFNFSDVGNAERFVHIYGDNIRYNSTRFKWLVWNGKYWEIDNTGKVERLSKAVIRKLQLEGKAIDEDKDEKSEKLKKQIASFVLKSENDSRIKAMINQARSQTGVSVQETQLDKDIYLLNLKNGTLNLKSGQFDKHNRKNYITKMINVDYKKDNDCPNWKAFLSKIFLGDTELIDYIQKTIGYSLTGSVTEQCFYMLYGNGANGKSTFLNTIQKIAGDYADSLKGSSLMVKRNDDGARGDLAKLKGKRFVIASELNEGQTFDESLIKALTGGDIVPVRFLYGEEFPLVPQFKLWIGTNEKPKVKGTNLGIWRRVRLIPFLYTFKDEEKDENFFEKFIEPELPGILNWAIEGCLKWQSEGIETPNKVKAAVDDYKTEMDFIQRFLNDCCVIAENCTAKVPELYEIYTKWCRENNEFELSNMKFTKKLKEKGFIQDRNTYCRFWKGLGIATDSLEGMTEVDAKVVPFQSTFL